MLEAAFAGEIFYGIYRLADGISEQVTDPSYFALTAALSFGGSAGIRLAKSIGRHCDYRNE